MEINRLSGRNFGVYKGDWELDLKRNRDEERNVVVIRGQNGAGKSTIMEALMLGLLGTLSQDDRLRKQEYQNYLADRIHKSAASDTNPTEAEVKVEFNFYRLGQPHRYRVQRKWWLASHGTQELLELFEDGSAVEQISNKEKELVLRQIFSPAIGKLVFFDGEQIQGLSVDGGLDAFLEETCKSVLGLNLVDYLQTDIQRYLARIKKDAQSERLSQQLESTNFKMAEFLKAQAEFTATRTLLVEESKLQEMAIRESESQFALEGRWDDEAISESQKQKEILKAQKNRLVEEFVEDCNGLAPFFLGKKWLERVEARLREENNIETQRKTAQFIDEKLKDVDWKVILNGFLGRIDSNQEKELSDRLSIQLSPREIADSTIRHPLSDQDRESLLFQIAQAPSAGAKLRKDAETLVGIDESLKSIELALEAVPAESSFRLHLKTHHILVEELGKKKAEIKACDQRLDEIKISIYHEEREQKRLQAQVLENNALEKKTDLAVKTQYAIREYADRLLREKLDALAKQVVIKFNLLCRKENFVERAEIHPQTFRLSLFGNGHELKSSYFSAGERQLLGISVIWAVRELTSVAIPLVIDTPLGRLDSEHRNTMLELFLPAVSHQVIIVGTDEEMNDDALKRLAPHISALFEIDSQVNVRSSCITRSEKFPIQELR